jgi:hypothetical protein
VSTWDPLLTKLGALKLQLKVAPTLEAAKEVFEDFVATGPTDDELDLAATYLGWTIFEIQQGYRPGLCAKSFFS